MLKAAIIHIPNLYKNENNELVSDINYCATGLFSLASEIKKEGFEVEIIHLGIEKYLNKNFILSDYIKENNINLVALSMNWHKQAYDVIEVAKKIKEKNASVHITLGGLTASYFASEILKKYDFIDSIIIGEGEEALKSLAINIQNNFDFSNIKNLCYRKNNEIIFSKTFFVPNNETLSDYNFTDFSLMKNFSEYLKVPFILNYSKKDELKENSPFYPISLGRGCLGNCLWCGGGYKATKEISKRDFISYKNPSSVIKEIKKLKEYGIDNFAFSFDPNNKDRKPLINLLNEIEKSFSEKINAYYNLDGLVDIEFLSAFKKAFSPSSTLALSPVFYNEKLRKKYKSFYYSNKDLEDILSLMEKLEINSEIYFSIMMGIDEIENIKSKEYGEILKNKFKFIKDVLIYPITLEPNSPLFNHPEKYNIKEKLGSFIDYLNPTSHIINSFENKTEFI